MNTNKKQGETMNAPARFANGAGTFLLGATAVLCLTAAKLMVAGAPVNLRSAASFAGLVGAAVFLAHGLGHLTGILGFRQALQLLGFRPQPANRAVRASKIGARHPQAFLVIGYRRVARTKRGVEVLLAA